MLSNTIRCLVVAVFAAAVVGVPAFELAKGSLRELSELGEFSWTAIRTGEAARVAEETLDRAVDLPKLCRPYYNEVMFETLGVATEKVVVGDDGWMFFGQTVRDYPPGESQTRLSEVVEVVAEFGRWLESEGIALTVILVPNKASVVADAVPRLHPPFRPVYAESVAALRAAGVDTVDLDEVLKNDGDPLFFKADTHWRPEGAEAAAYAVRDHLAKRYGDGGWPGDAIELLIGPRGTVPMRGGLLRMLGIREDGSLYERLLEEKNVVDAFDLSKRAAAVFGDSEKVALFGTSFSHGYRFANLCASTLSRRVEDNAAEGIGATFPLMEHAQRYLRSEGARPEMILWEFPERFIYISSANTVDPTRAIVEASRFDPARRVMLDGRSAKAVDLDLTGKMSNGLAVVHAKSSRARVAFDFEEPLAGDGSEALVFTVASLRRMRVRVKVDTGGGLKNAFGVTVVGHDAEQLICFPIVTHRERPAKRIEIDFVTKPADLRVSGFEIWPVRSP